MKEKIASLLRHAATYAAGGVAYLVSLPIFEAEDAAQITEDSEKLLAGLVGLLTVTIFRAVLWAVAKWAPGLGGFFSRGMGSFLLVSTAAVTLGGVLTSCAPLVSAVTGAPIPSTTVVRAGQPDAQPIQVAGSDRAVAEDEARRAEILNEPPAVHGLYNAGRAAEVAREVFIEGSK